ncbi:MAG: molybdate ABC transporter substrate-binding protein [Bryobacteraceae bacterium]
MIAAAADLAPLQQPLQKAFPNDKLTFTLGSSGNLSKQIANGAPYDLFLSANFEYAEDLVRAGKADSVETYAYGQLGLYSPGGMVRSLADLANLRNIAIANPAHAPYGVAAKQALEGAGIWKLLQSKIVYGENVRQAFQFAESGNADAFLGAWTLIKDKGGVLLPRESYRPITQAATVIKGSPNLTAARGVLDFLKTPSGRKILENAGLIPAK